MPSSSKRSARISLSPRRETDRIGAPQAQSSIHAIYGEDHVDIRKKHVSAIESPRNLPSAPTTPSRLKATSRTKVDPELEVVVISSSPLDDHIPSPPTPESNVANADAEEAEAEDVDLDDWGMPKSGQRERS